MLCMDYYKLNSVTIQEAYLHLRLNESLHGCPRGKQVLQYFGPAE